MIDLNDYFNPVSIEGPDFEQMTAQAGFPHNITIYTENTPLKDLSKYKIRTQLYRLAKIPGKLKIIDLGNMKQGMTFYDTLAGLTDILSFLMNENLFPVIIGGSSALIPAIDMALSENKTKYTLSI